ncbi:EF-hand domain-containing protein [Antarcticimicrobium sediminis]|uniref:Calcium-binding protein n=1 Tax=Antarcticimicrobium sediminis TaxID=2546227 RepID=A0A4R5F0M2_9RHOB|nr:EF-hand domain-containing protein [Antarcticimicrobium sediminis]TDE41028.1 calcium-binding protein [Antarcticimicrobium sediminis]
MKHRHFIAGLVLSAGVLGTGAVLAQGQMNGQMGGHGMHQRPTFEELDANKDGTLTSEEMLAHAQSRFATADADGDGKLSLEEMQAQARKRADDMAAKMLKRMDQNGDGAVTFDEMPGQRRESRMEQMFSRSDADGSGGLTKEEFDRAHDRMGRDGDRKGGRMGRDMDRKGDRMGDHKRMHERRMGGDCDGPARPQKMDNN